MNNVVSFRGISVSRSSPEVKLEDLICNMSPMTAPCGSAGCIARTVGLQISLSSHGRETSTPSVTVRRLQINFRNKHICSVCGHAHG